MKSIRLKNKINQLVLIKTDIPSIMEVSQVRMDKQGNQFGKIMVQGTIRSVVLKKGDASRVWREVA